MISPASASALSLYLQPFRWFFTLAQLISSIMESSGTSDVDGATITMLPVKVSTLKNFPFDIISVTYHTGPYLCGLDVPNLV